MLPELVRIGPVAVYTYGFAITLAFLLGILLAEKRARRVGLASGTIWGLSMWIMIASLVGARLLYVLTHVDEFQGHWLDVVNPVQSDGRFGIAGMVLLGGVAGGTAAAILYIRRHQLPLWTLADVIAPSLALGIAIGRLGCFANGCCYGHPTEAFCGVVFPRESLAGSHFPGVPVLPTQLFESAWGFLLFGFLLFSERWKKFTGFTFSLFLIGYALFRIWVDTVRIYGPGEFLVNSESLRVTVSQGLSAAMLVWGVWLFFHLKGKAAEIPARKRAPIRRVK
ncbi:MAG: prolipoprotein diacylglyceryl transferase [Candidatus Zixiibacteriota bacterium]|nr:MAG: prolipoprotein diacylglyceryl transferase [candidate division Zixibacteria bacterium]